MTNLEFNHLVEHRLGMCRKVLVKKASEYAPDDEERLHNFYAGAAILGDTPAEYCLNLMTKHLVCVMEMARAEGSFDQGYIDEKFGDLLNYVLLLEALVVDMGGVVPE